MSVNEEAEDGATGPNMEDNFEQYSAGLVDRNSIEDSFKQYDESLDKFIEIDRRQDERRKMALRLIQDYKAMAITQQRSDRENLKFQERQKQEQAR